MATRFHYECGCYQCGDDLYRCKRHKMEHALREAERALKLAEAALEPVVTEAMQRVPGKIDDEDWNPNYAVDVPLSIAEIRAARTALAAIRGREGKP